MEITTSAIALKVAGIKNIDNYQFNIHHGKKSTNELLYFNLSPRFILD
jgi:hypothetical protein